MNKTKILFVSDSVQRTSGVAIQSLKLCKGLLKTGRYNVVQIAGGDSSSPSAPIYYEGIKLYTTQEPYGSPNTLRYVMVAERPDIVLAFSDPRFFTWLFSMDNEIRGKARLIFYHTWDNAPFPKFNLPWYVACDQIVMLSHFSYELMSSHGVPCQCIPHGADPSEFFPLEELERNKARQDLIMQSRADRQVNFIIFWNNRNIFRKRPGDVLYSFKLFSEKHPDTLLLLNTDIVDMEGVDLMHLIDDLDIKAPIVFNPSRVKSDRLNLMYNVADVTINIAVNEGFGLCVLESLCAGTPVIVTKTGGMPEQACEAVHREAIDPDIEGNDGKGRPEYDEIVEFGKVLEPDSQMMFGTLGAPYIFQDIVNYKTILSALEEAYQRTQRNDWKQTLGLQGRDHIIKNFHIDTTVKLWDELLQQLLTTPSPYKRWKVLVH